MSDITVSDEVLNTLLEKYDPDVFRNTVTTLASKMESSKSIEQAGRLIIEEIVRASGDINMYISVLGHCFSPRLLSFLRLHSVYLSKLLDDNKHLNYYDHDFFSASTLTKTYLMRPHFGDTPVETPLQMYLRVSIHLYAEQGLEQVVSTFFEMARHQYTQASPTLFNSGKIKSQGSSCFLATLDDTLESILGTGVRDMGLISKHKGGLGIGLGKIRHSAIKGSGMSSGTEKILRIFDELVGYVDQDGARAGAGTVYLPIWHIDLWGFINATNNFSQSHALRLTHLNTALWINDLFMRRVAENGDWTMFCPAKANLFGLYGEEFETAYIKYELLAKERDLASKVAVDELSAAKADYLRSSSVVESIAAAERLSKAHVAKRAAEDARINSATRKAREIFDHIVNLEIKSGFPYVMYGDSINDKSNQANIGKVNSSNLCVEIVEVSTPETIASCNLASVSLKSCARKPFPKDKLVQADALTQDEIVAIMRDSGCFDFEMLGSTTRSIVNNLDSLITHNYYPVADKTEKLNLSTRPLGIGVSGFSDAVAILDLLFESKVTEVLNKAIFACMYFNALSASVILAAKHGSYDGFRSGEFTLAHVVGDDIVVNRPSRKMVPLGQTTDSVFPGIVNETFSGSPASQGFLQFHLWKIRAKVLECRGLLDAPIYKKEDDEPIKPKSWGQAVLDIPRTDTSWEIKIDANWDSIRQAICSHGLRNSMLLAVMPTASSAQVLRNAESTEAHSANIYTRTLMTGRFTVVNQHLVKDLEEIKLWNKRTLEYLTSFQGTMKYFPEFVNDFPEYYPEFHSDKADPEFRANKDKSENITRLMYIVEKYKTMFELSQKVILRYARQRGPYIDQSQSTNIYMEDPSPGVVKAVHMFGWKLGLKTGLYYLRQKTAAEGSNFGESARMLEYKEKRLKKISIVEPSPQVACSLKARVEGVCTSCE